MNRLRFLVLAVASLIVPASSVRSAPVPAGRSGLDQVPDSAPLVIHLRGIKGTHDRLVNLMKKALPDVWKKYESQIDDFFEKGPDNVLSGRKLSGLAEDGPHFLALLELPKPTENSPPKMAFILTVKDYKEFHDNILTEEQRKNSKDEGDGIESVNTGSDTAYFVDRKGYAIITPDKETAEKFTKNKKITGLHKKLKPDQVAKLLASDLGVYVDMDAVNKEYGDQIKQAKQNIEQAISFVAAAGGDESQKQAAEAVKTALPHIFQTIEEMQTLIATFELRTGGLAVHLHGDVKESSTTAGYLQDSRPVPFKELEQLPKDRDIYLGMKASSDLFKKLSSLMSGLPGEDSKGATDLVNELAKAGPESILFGASFPLSGLLAYHYNDPAKAVAAQVKILKARIAGDSDPKSAGLKEKPVLKTDAKTHGDFKLHSLQLVWDFDKLAEPAAAKGGEDAKKQLIEFFKGFLGEKMNVWFGTDGKTAVQLVAPDWETASKLLDQYTKGGSSAMVKALRKEMPARTSFLAMFDGIQMLKLFLDFTKPLLPPGLPLPPDWPNMSAKGALAYIGLAVTLQPNRGGLDLFLTADAVGEFYKVVLKPLVGE